MPLPLSRNTTYDIGVEVNPEDLNDLQDSIAGGKHGLIEITIPAVDFVADVNSGGWALNEHWTNSTNENKTIFGPLVLPVGAIVTEVKGYFNSFDTARTKGLKVQSRNNTDGTLADEIAESTMTTSAYAPITLSGLITISATKAYKVVVRASTGSANFVSFLGCTVKYYVP